MNTDCPSSENIAGCCSSERYDPAQMLRVVPGKLRLMTSIRGTILSVTRVYRPKVSLSVSFLFADASFSEYAI